MLPKDLKSSKPDGGGNIRLAMGTVPMRVQRASRGQNAAARVIARTSIQPNISGIKTIYSAIVAYLQSSPSFVNHSAADLLA